MIFDWRPLEDRGLSQADAAGRAAQLQPLGSMTLAAQKLNPAGCGACAQPGSVSRSKTSAANIAGQKEAFAQDTQQHVP